MKLEELTQEELDGIVQMAKQRQALAAIIANTMEEEATSPDAIAIKAKIMMSMTVAIALGAMVGDDVDKRLLTAMKDHCKEQIEINDLLNEI
jgi:hypothetical protein